MTVLQDDLIYEILSVVSEIPEGRVASYGTKMKNASYCVSYGKEGRLQQNEQKNSFCYSPFLFALSGTEK